MIISNEEELRELINMVHDILFVYIYIRFIITLLVNLS